MIRSENAKHRGFEVEVGFGEGYRVAEISVTIQRNIVRLASARAKTAPYGSKVCLDPDRFLTSLITTFGADHRHQSYRSQCGSAYGINYQCRYAQIDSQESNSKDDRRIALGH